jgi:hypothetical protein
MNPGRILRTGITASAIAHLSALALLLFFTEVHPFGSVTAEPITVDLVPAAELPPPKAEVASPEKEAPVPEPKAQPSDAPDPSSKAQAQPQAAAEPPPASPPQQPPKQPAKQPQQQAAPQPPTPATQPATQPASAQQPPAPTPSPAPSYVPPQPDLSVKYHVMLGLPPELPTEPTKGKPSDFDAQASKAADIDSSLVAEFRRRLRSCSKLPASVAASDKLRITLRVVLTVQGTLAADPILIEASASPKGPALMQGAVAALRDCQPYAMLPADRYGEWKVLDLSFTPQDFSG